MCKLKQTKNPKQENEIMKINLNTLHVQRKFWKPHNRTYFCLSSLCVKNNQDVYIKHAQIMHCILCHSGLVNASNPRTQATKRLIS